MKVFDLCPLPIREKVPKTIFTASLIINPPQILENSEKWGVDMFRISELTDKKTLTCVTYTIFQERDLIKTFKIPGKVFLNFLRTLEDHYLQVGDDVSYQNSVIRDFCLN